MTKNARSKNAITGLKMIWAGVKWISGSAQAPWSVVPISAIINPHVYPWCEVMFRAFNDNSFDIEFLTIRTISPGVLSLRDTSNEIVPEMIVSSEAYVIENLGWAVAAGASLSRTFFVNVNNLRGQTTIDFELRVRFYDNLRREVPVWVRTKKLVLL